MSRPRADSRDDQVRDPGLRPEREERLPELEADEPDRAPVQVQEREHHHDPVSGRETTVLCTLA